MSNWKDYKPLPPLKDSRTCKERQEDGCCPLLPQPAEDVIEKINKYITRHFIGRPEDFSDNECLSEARELYSLISPSIREDERRKIGEWLKKNMNPSGWLMITRKILDNLLAGKEPEATDERGS